MLGHAGIDPASHLCLSSSHLRPEQLAVVKSAASAGVMSILTTSAWPFAPQHMTTDASVQPRQSDPRTLALGDRSIELLRDHLRRCEALGRAIAADRFVFSPRPGNTEFFRPHSMSQKNGAHAQGTRDRRSKPARTAACSDGLPHHARSAALFRCRWVTASLCAVGHRRERTNGDRWSLVQYSVGGIRRTQRRYRAAMARSLILPRTLAVREATRAGQRRTRCSDTDNRAPNRAMVPRPGVSAMMLASWHKACPH